MNARRRRFLAVLLAFALAFSQLAVAAYACPIDDASTIRSAMPSAEPMADCDVMPAKSDAAPNLCEAHCLVATQVQSDGLALAAVETVPPLVVRTVPTSPTGWGHVIVGTASPLPTPPPLLRFARLLI